MNTSYMFVCQNEAVSRILLLTTFGSLRKGLFLYILGNFSKPLIDCKDLDWTHKKCFSAKKDSFKGSCIKHL